MPAPAANQDRIFVESVWFPRDTYLLEEPHEAQTDDAEKITLPHPASQLICILDEPTDTVNWWYHEIQETTSCRLYKSKGSRVPFF